MFQGLEVPGDIRGFLLSLLCWDGTEAEAVPMEAMDTGLALLSLGMSKPVLLSFPSPV